MCQAPTFEFLMTRDSEKERVEIRARDDRAAWNTLVTTHNMRGVEKIVLTTVRG